MIRSIKNIRLSNGIHIPYVEEGDFSSLALIFLHGFLGSWRSFEPVLDELPESVHAIALTQRGHGEASQPRSGYRVTDWSNDLAEFLDSKQLSEALLVGHSMGSAIAQRFAIDHPDRVSGMVLAGATSSQRDNPGLQKFFDSTIASLEDPVDPSLPREFLASMWADSIPDEKFDIILEDAVKVPARVWIQAFEARLSGNNSMDLEEIQCPMMLIWGDQDPRSLRSDQNELLSRIQNSNLKVYQGAGHLPHLEEASRFASDVLAFYERVTRNAR